MCSEDLVQAKNIPDGYKLLNYSFFLVSTFGNSPKDLLLNMTYLEDCVDKYTPWTSVDIIAERTRGSFGVIFRFELWINV